MANAEDLKNLIEPHVREWFRNEYNQSFETEEIPLKLKTGGQHKFDVVSKNRTIVGGIKATTLRKKGGVGVGVIKSAFTELYYLSLVEADKKFLILTDKGFYEHFKKISSGKILSDTKIIYCQLPKRLSDIVAEIHKTASEEIGKK